MVAFTMSIYLSIFCGKQLNYYSKNDYKPSRWVKVSGKSEQPKNHLTTQ